MSSCLMFGLPNALIIKLLLWSQISFLDKVIWGYVCFLCVVRSYGEIASVHIWRATARWTVQTSCIDPLCGWCGKLWAKFCDTLRLWIYVSQCITELCPGFKNSSFIDGCAGKENEGGKWNKVYNSGTSEIIKKKPAAWGHLCWDWLDWVCVCKCLEQAWV